MKKLLLILLCLPMIGFGQVMPMGDGIYTISESSGGFRRDVLQKRANKAIKKFAEERGDTSLIISITETGLKWGVHPKIEIKFCLLNESRKAKLKKDNQKYKALLRLGKLRDDGILTEEEFQIEKKKILSDE